MNDPRRLIDGSDSRLVAQLLTAGRLEEPAPELIERCARSVALALAAGVVADGVVSTATALGTAPAGNVVPLAGASAASAALPGAGAASAAAASAPAGAASLAGAGTATLGSTSAAAGWAGGGALANGALAKGALGAAGLLKSGAAGAVLAKWLGIGIISATVALASPRVLHWVEQREHPHPAAPREPALPERTSREATAAAKGASPERATSAPLPATGAPRSSGPQPGPAKPATESVALARPAVALDAAARAAAPAAAPAQVPPQSGAPERGVARAVSRASGQSVTALPSASYPVPRATVPFSAQPERPPHTPQSLAAAPPPSPPRTLGAELARVDRARAELARGEARQALRELDGYERAFPARQLGLEVAMLRMEALLQLGDLTRARELAQRILAGSVPAPHARRAREVLESRAP